jgi:hypothetical protein
MNFERVMKAVSAHINGKITLKDLVFHTCTCGYILPEIWWKHDSYECEWFVARKAILYYLKTGGHMKLSRFKEHPQCGAD